MMKTLQLGNRKNLIQNKNGFGIPVTALPIVVLFTVISGALMTIKFWGIFPFVLFSALLSHRIGNYIDLANKEIAYYYTIYWFKFGHWESIRQYDCIWLSKTKEGSRIASARAFGVNGIKVYSTVYYVNLVNSKNLDYIQVSRHKSPEDADVKLKMLMTNYGFKYINRVKELKERKAKQLNKR